MTDPIADMLIRIRNAQAVGKETVAIPFSKMKQEIARVLKQKHLISDFEKKGRTVARKLEIKLKYFNSFPAISSARRLSKPGQRLYIKNRASYPRGRGTMVIISTSKGVMSDDEARKAKLGGEVLCEVS